MNASAALTDARTRTDALFDLVHPDSLYERPIPERHRIVFYLGHLEAFDWNLLRPHMRGAAVFNAPFDRLFAFGIDPVNGGLPADSPADWPSLEEIRTYSRLVRQALDDAEHDSQRLHMAIEHRLMHAETLSYMLHQMPLERKLAPPQPIPGQPSTGQTARSEMIPIPAGYATLGLARNGEFGWDNEFNEHQADVPAFAIDRFKVTNGDFLRFMDAGGYRNQSLWTASAWQWKTEGNITRPACWKFADGEWRYRAMFGEIPLPPEWPVYVSHAEASAYARWAGSRLPSEGEWHRAAYGAGHGFERAFPWGDEPPGAQHGYFSFACWDPAPVNAFPAARSAFGLDGLLANGWEWTGTPFAPFSGFEAHSSYAGYSADFFDGAHYVLKGGSTRTASSMLRRSFRNWFQPHYQYVYAGFRCARDM